MDPYFLIFEFGAFFALLRVCRHERNDRKMLTALLLAFLYGMILEALNIRMSKEIYVYSGDFAFQALGVPLAIGAGWSIIYYLSLKLSEPFYLSWWQAPFLMALIALTFDLTIDAVAIRLGFWHWKLRLDEEWFGVPYDNFFGWLAVMWTFGLSMNLSYRDNIKPAIARIIRLTAPLASALLLGAQIMFYESLAAVLSGRYSLREISTLNDRHDYSYAFDPIVRTARSYLFLSVIVTLLVACSFWIYKQKKVTLTSRDPFPLHTAAAVHLLFLSFLLISGICYTAPLILPIAVFLLILGFLLVKMTSVKTIP
jgi:uncharacterized membrane protein